jgi:hypothetical protein
MMALKSNIKSLLNRFFAEYRINVIYASRSEPTQNRSHLYDAIYPVSNAYYAALANSPTAKMRNSAGFYESGLDGFVIEQDGRLVCVAHFADQARYDRAQTWPLAKTEMALMDIATEEVMRGNSLAVRLICSATEMYLNQGKRRVIAFIWWSNTPSVRAFKKAGWYRIGFSIEALVMGKWLSLRIPV